MELLWKRIKDTKKKEVGKWEEDDNAVVSFDTDTDHTGNLIVAPYSV